LTPEMLSKSDSEQLIVANIIEGALKIQGVGNMLHLHVGDED